MALSMNFAAEDKKKLYLLGGLLGILGVVGTLFIIKPMFSGADPEAGTASDTVSANAVVSNSASAPTPPNSSVQFGKTGSSGTSSSVASAGAAVDAKDAVLEPQLIGVGRSRTNPFAPEEIVPVALPTPVPVVRPRYRPVTTFETLPPVQIAPYSPEFQSTTISLPSNGFAAGSSGLSNGNGGNATTSRILLNLPPAAIFGNTARTAPRTMPVVGGLELASPGAQANIENASDKRVVGVIIGDTIRALIEYEENGRRVSRVVQPGDTVAGMEILSIRRLAESGETITRVTVRENGQEKYFDLSSR